MVIMLGDTNCLSQEQTGKTLIRLLLQKQSDLGLHCLSMPTYGSQLVFVCVVALCPESTATVMVGRPVYLTTLFPGQA